MASNRIMINNQVIKQPDEGLGYNFETTYTEDSGRVMSGAAHVTPLFTVEQFSYSATNLTITEMSRILQLIAKGRKFTMFYPSPYYGAWREDTFYVGRGSLEIGTWNDETQLFSSLSFNIVGVNPLA